MGQGQERRRKKRFQSQMFCEISSPTLGSKLGRGVVTDVSISGMAIQTETDLEPGQSYECHIEVPLSIKVTVIRQIKPGQMKQYGLRFVDQGFMDKMILRKVIKGKLRTEKI